MTTSTQTSGALPTHRLYVVTNNGASSSWREIGAAWRSAGFRPVGHIAFVKCYASSRGYLHGQHEMAYLLAKGRPPKPKRPISDVIEFAYTGNIMHPTQKPIGALKPLIECFTQAGDLVFDPFLGSGSTLTAAAQLGIECDATHYRTACTRLR